MYKDLDIKTCLKHIDIKAYQLLEQSPVLVYIYTINICRIKLITALSRGVCVWVCVCVCAESISTHFVYVYLFRIKVTIVLLILGRRLLYYAEFEKINNNKSIMQKECCCNADTHM